MNRMLTLKIDPRSGEITVDGKKLAPLFRKEEVFEMFGAVPPVVENAGWSTYRLLNQVSQKPLGLLVIFKGTHLRQAKMVLFGGESWDYDVENVASIKAKHDEFLLSELGAVGGRFKWGTVVSEIDPKTQTSSIVISYK